jgi:hypothetical protein
MYERQPREKKGAPLMDSAVQGVPVGSLCKAMQKKTSQQEEDCWETSPRHCTLAQTGDEELVTRDPDLRAKGTGLLVPTSWQERHGEAFEKEIIPRKLRPRHYRSNEFENTTDKARLRRTIAEKRSLRCQKEKQEDKR